MLRGQPELKVEVMCWDLLNDCEVPFDPTETQNRLAGWWLEKIRDTVNSMDCSKEKKQAVVKAVLKGVGLE